MCGLVAIVSKQKNGIFHSDMKVFTEMLFADQLRGADGTGIIYNKKKEIKTLKAAVASSDFVSNELYDKAEKDIIQEGNFVVGHNRSATKGKIIQANTHPFREKHITLVHNGTLTWHKDLADVEVDSHAICISLAEKGLKETLKKTYGAYALIWVDNKQKTLNVIRNNQRPLYIIETPFLFIFISEKKLAEWILDRNNQTITSVKEVPIDTLFQFEFGVWDKYETTKIETRVNSGYIPQNYNGKVVPYQAPITSEKIVDTNPKIGDKIKFIPLVIDEEFGTKILGEFEDRVTGDTYEVKWWTKDKKEAEDSIDEMEFEGIISHIVFKPSNKTKSLIVRNVCLPEKVKSSVGTSNNKYLILQSDIDKLEEKCTCCNVKYNKNYIAENIKDCDITFTGKTVEYTCPDCTSWLNSSFHFGGGV